MLSARRVLLQPSETSGRLDAAVVQRDLAGCGCVVTVGETIAMASTAAVNFFVADVTPASTGRVTTDTAVVLMPPASPQGEADDDSADDAVGAELIDADIAWPSAARQDPLRPRGTVAWFAWCNLSAVASLARHADAEERRLLWSVSSRSFAAEGRGSAFDTPDEVLPSSTGASTGMGRALLSPHGCAILGASAGDILSDTANSSTVVVSVHVAAPESLAARALAVVAKLAGTAAAIGLDAASFATLRAAMDDDRLKPLTDAAAGLAGLVIESPVNALQAQRSDYFFSKSKAATRVTFANLSALDARVPFTGERALAAWLRPQMKIRLSRGMVIPVVLGRHGKGGLAEEEARLQDDAVAAADLRCASDVTILLRVEEIFGGDILVGGVTEVALAGPSSRVPHAGFVPPSCVPEPLRLCSQQQPAYKRLVEALHQRRVGSAHPARQSTMPWCASYVVSGTAVNCPCEIAQSSAAVLGFQTVIVDARLLDGPTALDLIARTAFAGVVVVLRHLESVDATGELARWAVAAASQQSWAREHLDARLSTELAALAQHRNLTLIQVFEGTDPVPPAFAAVACEPPIVCGTPDDVAREAMLDSVLASLTERAPVAISRRSAAPTWSRPLLSWGCNAALLASWSVGLGTADMAQWITTCVATTQATIRLPTPSMAAAPQRCVAVVDACDFERALKDFQAQHGHSLTSTKLQPVKWDDVGGLEQAKKEILETIELPLKHPELFAGGAKQRAGVLMYGPPGCGKTLLAKAIATEMGINFMSVKGPELINMYVGESEKNIRLLFQRARDNSPCICFFDELDALAPKRGAKGDSGGVMDRIVAQLLSEVDGVGGSKSDGSAAAQVFVIGATNRPDLLDPSLLRPGRFDRLCYLGPPANKAEQLAAVRALTRKFALAADVDLAAVVEPLEPIYSGADYFALCSDAMMMAVTEEVDRITAVVRDGGRPSDASSGGALRVEMRHFTAARANLKPSVSPADLKRYEGMKTQFGGGK